MHSDQSPAIETYRALAKTYRAQVDHHSRTIRTLSVFRLLSFAVAAWQTVLFFRNAFNGQHLFIAGAAFLVFLVLLLVSFERQRQKKKAETLLRINENELAVTNGAKSFLQDGREFRQPGTFTEDLNIFGPGSLYHMLNRAASQAGRQSLAAQLTNPLTDREAIRQAHDSVRELGSKTSFRQALLGNALLIDKETGTEQLIVGIDDREFAILRGKAISVLATAWPLAGTLLLLYALYSGEYRLLLLFLVAGLMIAATLVRKTGKLYNHISRRGYLYTQYAGCFRVIAAENFAGPELERYRQSVMEAEKAFVKLSRIVNTFDVRLNILLTPIANGLFLSDLLSARAYLRWSRKYQPKLAGWFDTLGKMEMLNSLATFHYNHPSFVFPEPAENRLCLAGENVGHPLMKEDAAVLNTVSLGEDGKLQLITGSNMAGKSTYLRTVGLNLVLAQAGAPVFAEKFVFTPMQVLTSFHHIDSLEDSTSYFYAELKSLQRIITSLSEGAPALVLLDEVLRGTNSTDKHDGTALLVRKLLSFNCLAMIATHDTDLGTLASEYPGLITNYCFESNITSDGLRFDFKRRPGVAHTRNATYLMKQIGII